MLKHAFAVPLLALAAAACASVPAPATRSPQSPAHPEAPEAATPPLSPGLMTGAEATVPAPASPEPHAGHAMPASEDERPAAAAPKTGASTSGHEGHHEGGPAPAGAGPAEASYTCPMHPQVKSAKPGACPICGMALVKKKSEDPNR